METKAKPMPIIALWYLLGDMIVRGLGVITTPIFSRLLTRTEYGSFSNFSSWESILLVIVTLDLSTSIVRAKYDYGENISEYLSSITLISTFFTCIVYSVIECNMPFFCTMFSMEPFYIRLLFIYLLLEPAYEYIQAKHRMYMKYKFFLFFSVSSAIFRTGISLLLVHFMEDKLMGRALGYVVPVSCMYFIIYCHIIIKGKTIKWEYCKYALSISIPLIPHTLSAIILSSSDRIMITKYCGGEQTALYSLAYTVASIVILIHASINKAWAPWFYDELNSRSYDTIKKYANYYIDGFLFFITGVMLISPELVLILGGKPYNEASYVIPPVMGASACQFVYTLYVNIETYHKKTGMISTGTVMAALLNFVLNLIFIPAYGYIAAAYTTFAGYMALAAFHFFIVRKNLKMSFIYNNGTLFAKLFFFTGLQFICTLLYHTVYIRHICVFLYLAVFIVFCLENRKAIIKVCRKNLF